MRNDASPTAISTPLNKSAHPHPKAYAERTGNQQHDHTNPTLNPPPLMSINTHFHTHHQTNNAGSRTYKRNPFQPTRVPPIARCSSEQATKPDSSRTPHELSLPSHEPREPHDQVCRSPDHQVHDHDDITDIVRQLLADRQPSPPPTDITINLSPQADGTRIGASALSWTSVP